ncbi:MAG TPA: ABC transporter ATP-binding protein [Candidatus Limnocylindria bacterium]|jgi:iron(III) transport system ATP-binding protein|nr:ABC transporter ATP-binding protein [Candidatus Limnocylindria bacterium]
MKITVRNLIKRFGPTAVLKDISLEIQDRELFFLLGPSGCGKTTLLRLIAGFYQPDGGELLFGDRRMNNVPPHLRNTGMVFQNYALWPHMTVAENVAYGLDVRKVAALEKQDRVRAALETVRMGPFADRTPNQLSGGQQQRVALARALVIRPDVLLLDEPLSNLDARLRLEMRDEIRRIHSETKITTVYVTHDQKESLSLADRMAVLRDGVVEQLADPRTVYRRPANKFVADFIGETNWVEASVASTTAGRLEIACPLGTFVAEPRDGMAVGRPVWLGFRPEAVRLEGAALNSFGCRLEQVNYLGEIEEYLLATAAGVSLKAFTPNPERLLPVGTALEVSLRPQDLLVLPR